jgi:alkylhydroperoxidase family enzyme
MARIPYPDLDAAPPHVREVFDALPVHLNIFRMLAHAETLLRPYLRFGAAVLTQTQLDPKLREIAILEVARLTPAPYEWVQHVPIAQATGASTEEIAAVERGDLEADCLGPDERLVLSFTGEVLRDVRASDDTFAAISERFLPREVVELLLTIGSYMMLARVMATLDLELDEPAGTRVVDSARERRE